MLNSVSLGCQIGYLSLGEGTVVEAEEAMALPDDQLVVVATGSQGEPLSALARMASGEHKHIKVDKGDTIIFSARVIPGNERAILTLTNLFHAIGATVVDNRYHTVHASGHGQIEELKLMLDLTKPKYLIPIHGEPQHVLKHAALAMETGMAADRVKILRNGQRLMFSADGSCSLGAPARVGRMVVDGNRLGPADDPVLRSRLSLAEMGLVYVILVLRPGDLSMATEPRVNIKGLHYEDEPDLELEAMEVTRRTFEEWRERQSPPMDRDFPDLIESVKRNVRRLFKTAISRKSFFIYGIIYENHRNFCFICFYNHRIKSG
jgi:ribonuclease J